MISGNDEGLTTVMPSDTGGAKPAAVRFAAGLSMNHIIASIENGLPFSAIKLCHGFWEQCVRFERTAEHLGYVSPLDARQWADVVSRHAVNWPVELFLESRALIQTAHQRPDVLALVSPLGWQGGYEAEGTPYEGLAEVNSVISSWFDDRTPRFDGLFWKNAVQDGSFVEFLRCLQDRPVLVIGPHHVERFIEFAEFRNAEFVEVDSQKAAWHRHATLQAVSEKMPNTGQDGLVCLIQAGGLTSTWLVYQLAALFPRSSFLALGQVLNLGSLDRLRPINWYAAHHRSITRTARLINPAWVAREIDGELGSTTPRLSPEQRLVTQIKNYEPTLYDEFQLAIDRQPCSRGRPAGFIENKPVDAQLTRRLLTLSQSSNHWANFGPVSDLLERSLHRLLSLPNDRRVVTCKSATDAILTLVDMREFQTGRSMTWVVSSFGFFSTRIGFLTNATVVDCDETGILDFEALRSLPLSEWDGVIVTNPFALADDFADIVEFARANDKKIIVDNATALFTPCRSGKGFADEVISFHHTKPWGIGEGGVVIVSEADERLFRSLINFGVGLDESARRYARNSKMSDYDAALILQRLINLPNWRRLYELQRRRILSIAEPLGLRPLKSIPRGVVMTHVPLMAPNPVPKEQLDNGVLTLRKYYQPLEPGFRNAADVFDRIVCVPCHPQISECATDDIRDVLLKFID